jgi:UDPglucose--hexose-1-phosphate uridylyltransferase
MAELKWEQRWHPLRREWVIIAAHRQDRPWSGRSETAQRPSVPAYDPDCYLCPGNVRVSGEPNPDYHGVFVFDNDHPCVGPQAPRDLAPPPGDIYRNSSAEGIARVVCYHRRHDLTLAQLPPGDVLRLLRTWQAQHRELGSRPEVNHVLFFENKGPEVGVSNPHPHCQIYATNFVFKTIENESRFAAEHHRDTGRSLLGDMIEAELADGRRMIAANDGAVAFVPYCARYAYETFVAPRRCVPSIVELDDAELADLADVLQEVVIRFDNLWQRPFPYVMALHQAPTDGQVHRGFHFHVEFHPPLRKPNLLKFLAGPEIGGGSFLSDTWPEDKAAELRAAACIHYTEQPAGDAQ